MNLLDRLSIISPDDAKRIKDASFNYNLCSEFYHNICNHVDAIRRYKREIAYLINVVHKRSRSEIIKIHINTIIKDLNNIEEDLKQIGTDTLKQKFELEQHCRKLYEALEEDNQCQT
jgi:hypothetical protein